MTAAAPIDAIDRAIVKATAQGLPLAPRPYEMVARAVGTSEADVIRRMQRMLQHGAIRRLGAVPNHYALGLAANGMTVWDVDDDRVETLGAWVGALDFVSHCYLRPRRPPEWPYNLFAMVHGASRDEVRAKAARIAALLAEACRGADIIFSTRILKKAGLRLPDQAGLPTSARRGAGSRSLQDLRVPAELPGPERHSDPRDSA